MDPLVIGLVTLTLLFILVLLGMHIAVALALMSFLGVWLSVGDISTSMAILSKTAYHAVNDYTYGIVPLFVLMGLFTTISGAGSEIFNAFHVLLRRIRGGLGMATVGASAVFATTTGISVASASVFSKIAIEPMTRLNYDKKLALGTVAGSSVLGMLIPPSLLFIIYGMLAQESVGRLFIAGILPGILLSLVYCVGIYIMATWKPSLVGGREKLSQKKRGWSKEDIQTLIKPYAVIILVVIMLGGLYGGWFTPTEAGAVGAFGAFLIILSRRQLTLKKLWDILVETSYTTASVLLILISAMMYSRMLSVAGVLANLKTFIDSLNVSLLLLVVIFLLIIVILGTILDAVSIMLITMPMMLPLLQDMGMDLIYFGVLVVIAAEIGLLTPPFGIVVFAMKSALGDQASIEEIFIGAFPFVIMMLLVIVILLMFPPIATWLPSLLQI